MELWLILIGFNIVIKMIVSAFHLAYKHQTPPFPISDIVPTLNYEHEPNAVFVIAPTYYISAEVMVLQEAYGGSYSYNNVFHITNSDLKMSGMGEHIASLNVYYAYKRFRMHMGYGSSSKNWYDDASYGSLNVWHKVEMTQGLTGNCVSIDT